MHFYAYLAALGAVLPTSLAAAKYYNLKTSLKPGQSGKSQFNNLYLSAYHSGAGFNDAVLVSKTDAISGYLVRTNSTPNDGHAYYNQQFDLAKGQPPYSMIMDIGVNTYAGWQPIGINAGGLDNADSAYNGFWINSTGLQWSSYPEDPSTSSFGGWLVCQWWRGVPQLFFNINVIDSGIKVPCSCAEVDLIPEYL